MTQDERVAEAIRGLEEQMAIFAGTVRANLRDSAAAIDPALHPFGLKLLQLLRRGGPIHAGTAAELLFVDKSVISRQARQLEDLGLTETLVDPNDGRARFLALTPKAVERMETVSAAGKMLMHQVLGTWSAGDLEQFAGYLARLSGPKT
ncbi:MarR family transcriptional regulator [Paeniglutamicibacter antarcticus]|uniref:MarR family transcriptional regulator n=1 Tax=Arthrobacter terrae TaxID=2935737 RepID=A0A931CSX5_9MICC|nr:MarR family transcriptional regulator [Arthrobacter terrae]MBG0741651.1 MarR family transcriptional regulator [Arthrobacter terrae]